jgi:hypothetical protein
VTEENDLRKQIVAKAIVDPEFRQRLLTAPHEVFGEQLSDEDLAGVERIKKFLPALEDITSSLAGEVLCGGGGGCGGLA